MLGPVVINKKEQTEFEKYLKEQGELFSLLQNKVSIYLLRQRQSEEKNWRLLLQKEEHSIRSLIHFMLDKKIASFEEVDKVLSQNQQKIRTLLGSLIH